MCTSKMQFRPFAFQYFLLLFNVDASFPLFFHLYLYAANSDQEFLRKHPLDLCQMFSIMLVLHCVKLIFCSVLDVCLQWLYSRTCTLQCFSFNLRCEYCVWFSFCSRDPGLDRKIGLDIGISYSTSSAVGKTMLFLSCHRKIVPVHTQKCLPIITLLCRLHDIPLPELWLQIGHILFKFSYIDIKFPICLTKGIIEAFVLSPFKWSWYFLSVSPSFFKELSTNSFAISRARTLANPQIFGHIYVRDILVFFGTTGCI